MSFMCDLYVIECAQVRKKNYKKIDNDAVNQNKEQMHQNRIKQIISYSYIKTSQ